MLGWVYSGGSLRTRDVEIWNKALIELPAEGNSIRKSSLKMIIKETSRAAVLKHGQSTPRERKQLVRFCHEDVTYTKCRAKVTDQTGESKYMHTKVKLTVRWYVL